MKHLRVSPRDDALDGCKCNRAFGAVLADPRQRVARRRDLKNDVVRRRSPAIFNERRAAPQCHRGVIARRGDGSAATTAARAHRVSRRALRAASSHRAMRV